MKTKSMKMLFLTAYTAILLAICTGYAAAETYSIKISCFIPALPGENIPIIKEQKIEEVKTAVNTPAMLQKETKEVRSLGNTKTEITLQTIYSK